MPMVLPRTRVLALCLTEDNHYHQATNASLELAASLRKLVPGASSIWLQSLGPFGESSRDLVNALSPPPSNPGPSTPLPRVTSINLAVAGATAATDVIRRNAADLQYLVLGRVSGGVLHSLVFPRHTALEGDHHHQRPPVWYPKLLRLVFSVKPGAHIYAGPQSSRQNPFPQLEELHFDDTLANGLPLEEWYAPLYDTLLRYESMRLQYLTFPIVYNTQRTVGRRNCPSLVGLRHIKCCWATGLWSAAQSDSDSTRVLKAIAEIPTLECYVHPSYIARLSSMPAKIYCRNLKHLDLFGWPLTLVDLEWILLSFGKLQTLRVTLTHSVENQYLHSAPPPVDCEALGMSAVACLTVGDVNGGLAQDELERLREIMASLPALTSASLYRQALVFVREAQSSSPSATSASMDHVQIVDLEGTLYGQAAGSSSQGFQSPLSQLAAGADVPPLNDITSWNVVHELLADE
ncbi:hypothetical protein GGF46_004139 [Coemansia sp. RSA 552]|nr:hypothetical protein GGF46_004139 [Coemansia sp. RSA 552]